MGWRGQGLPLDDAVNFPILSFTGEHTVDLPDTLVKTVWATVTGRCGSSEREIAEPREQLNARRVPARV